MRATLVSSAQQRILLIIFTDYVGRTRDEKPKVKFKGTSEDDNNSLYATVIGLFVGHVFSDASFSSPPPLSPFKMIKGRCNTNLSPVWSFLLQYLFLGRHIKLRGWGTYFSMVKRIFMRFGVDQARLLTLCFLSGRELVAFGEGRSHRDDRASYDAWGW